VKVIVVQAKTMMMTRAVWYRGASLTKKMFDTISPSEFKHARRIPVVNARAFKLGMFATVQAEKITLMGYAL
jgi:hypothetical protein